MGVLGFWNLIEESGSRVNIDTLDGKVLAIDFSIWINQAIKGFRDRDGSAIENAHILGLFHRLCKLLFYGVKPIFVFDGDSPALKTRTQAKRRERTQKSLEKAKFMSMNILEKYAQSQINPSGSGCSSQSTTESSASPIKTFKTSQSKKQADVYEDFVEMLKTFENKLSDSEADSDSNNSDQKLPYSFALGDSQNIRNIDIKSESFTSLPPIARYEILKEMREAFKGRKNPFPENLPTESDEFSSFQMNKLMKKRSLQEEINKLIDELNGQNDEDQKEFVKKFSSNTSVNHEKFFVGKLASDEKTRFVFLKKLSKITGNESILKLEDEEDQKIVENSIIEPEVIGGASVNHEDECKEDIKLAFDLPNNLLDQPESLLGMDRIEHLSQLQASTSRVEPDKFNSQGILNANKLCENDSQRSSELHSSQHSTQLKLSDEEASSSDEDDNDFVEVEDASQSSDERVLFEQIEMPYSTSYSLTITLPQKPLENRELSTQVEDNRENVSSPEKLSVDKSENNSMESVDNSDAILEVAQIDQEAQKVGDPESTQADNTVSLEGSTVNVRPKSPELTVEEYIEETNRINKMSRQAANVSDQMFDDCQKLLQLFGVPFIVAPAEAEAQCATLEELGLCEGTITDDSDIFLFGGRRVFRNFFSNEKYIRRYEAEDLVRHYGLDRSKMICLGMMCGTDYTVGIDGIGPVNGLEILGEFPGPGLQPLKDYAEWYRQRCQLKNAMPENKIRSKLMRFKLPASFPSPVVFDAYFNADTNKSTEKFSWAVPHLFELREYAQEHLGWSLAKADALLVPVMKKINLKQSQTRIDLFFPTVPKNSAINEKLKINRSKRLNAAIRQSVEASKKNSQTTSKQPPKKRTKATQRSKKVAFMSQQSSTLQLSEESSSDED